MREASEPTQQSEDLRYQALLYAAGEMHPFAAEAFETRLGSDAAAQQALVHAVQLAGLLDGQNYAPDPAYRAAVRETVLSGRRRWSRRFKTLWITGACAAAIGLIAIAIHGKLGLAKNSPATGQPEIAKTNPIATEATANLPAGPATGSGMLPAPSAVLLEPDDATDATETEETLGAAGSWTEFINHDWLRKVLESEQRRAVGDLRIERLPPPPELVE